MGAMAVLWSFLGVLKHLLAPPLRCPCLLRLKNNNSASVFRCASCHCGWHRYTLAHPWLRPCCTHKHKMIKHIHTKLHTCEQIKTILACVFSLFRVHWRTGVSHSTHTYCTCICIYTVCTVCMTEYFYTVNQLNQYSTDLTCRITLLTC